MNHPYYPISNLHRGWDWCPNGNHITQLYIGDISSPIDTNHHKGHLPTPDGFMLSPKNINSVNTARSQISMANHLHPSCVPMLCLLHRLWTTHVSTMVHVACLQRPFPSLVQSADPGGFDPLEENTWAAAANFRTPSHKLVYFIPQKKL